ncbi:MAG: GAF domain-containing protein [Clostridiales bacterium]|nr:GAF domain-containing protein [Clostridiales bacterium]
MKKTNLDTKLIICVYVLLFFQTVCLTLYAFLGTDDENAVLSAFAAMLSIEILALFTLGAVFLRRISMLVPKAVLTLKDGGERLPVFYDVDKAISDVKVFYDEERLRSKTLLELFKVSLKQPALTELLKEGLPLIMDISKAQACAYYSVNHASSKLELVDSCGFGRELYEAMDTDIGEGLEGACCKSGKICFFSEGSKDNKYNTISSIAKKNFKNIMALPVIDEGKCAGVLTLAYINEIKNENVSAGKDITAVLSAAHSGTLRHEEFLRQADELKLQNRMINEISESLKEKDAEIKKLKKEIKNKG